MKGARIAVLIAAAWLLAVSAKAYVTSATLEFVGDDKCGFYLNGRELLSKDQCEFLFFWWGCLSTSDGTLPLELFNANADNVLAAENFDIFGGGMWMGYRLTVHHSTGDPVVIWGLPDTRMLSVPSGHAMPPQWYAPKFDDAAWGYPKEVAPLNPETGGNFVRLEDSHFAGFLGKRGFVPFLSHSSDGTTASGTTDLYRNHFSFPTALGKVGLRMNPEKAITGQTVAFRLVPGNDIADFKDFQISGQLPAGLEPVQIGPGGTWSPSTRSLSWQYGANAHSVKYVSLNAETILSAPSWKNASQALGPFNQDLKRYVQDVPQDILERGAIFDPGLPGWFKMSRPAVGSVAPGSLILGVIFRAQVIVGGTNRGARSSADQIFLNYSVNDGASNGLKQDVLFSHAASSGGWTDAYYDATEDRAWTWADIDKLRVKIEEHQMGERAKGRLGSIRVIVRAFTPNTVAPTFYARVIEPGCKTLTVRATVKDLRSGATGSDDFTLPVNQAACPSPTPRPTIARPKPLQPGEPTPTPVTGVLMAGGLDLGLGCLRSGPEPFRAGGAFIYFCLKAPATVSVDVYDRGHNLLRSVDAGPMRPGNNQLFFNGIDSSDHPLKPGQYSYEVKATGKGAAAVRSANFTKAAERRDFSR